MKKLLLSLLVCYSAQAEFTVTAINGKAIPPTEFNKLVITNGANSRLLSPSERVRLRREEIRKKALAKPTNNIIAPAIKK